MSNRLVDAIRAVVRAEFPNLVYAGAWEYSVTGVNDDGTVNGVPTGPIPLPALNNIPFESLASGGTSKPTVGNTFVIEFLNMSGADYGIISCTPKVEIAINDALDTVDIAPTATNPLELGPAEKRTARSGDSVECFFSTGILNGTFVALNGDTTPIAGLPCEICTPAPGLIVAGSDKVFA